MDMQLTLDSLSEPARELLRAAADHQGNLALLRRSDTRGFAVHAGKRALYDRRDPEWASKFVEAIKELGGDITSSTYPNDDHFSLPQSSVDEARTWLNAKF